MLQSSLLLEGVELERFCSRNLEGDGIDAGPLRGQMLLMANVQAIK